MLLHGWAVTADLNFFPAYEPLADEHRVIALDHRGHGRGLRRPGPVRLSDCADDVAAVLDALGVDRAVVVGYSMGGAVAQLAWRRHRERVAGLVLCSTAGHFQGGPLSDLWYASYGPLARLAGVARGPADALLRGRVRRRVAGDPLGEWMADELLLADPAALLSSMRSIGRFRSNDWIGEVDVPTAVVVTTRDRTVPARRQRQLAASIPAARLLEVDGPHDAIVTHPGRYLRALTEACRDVVDAAATRPNRVTRVTGRGE